MQNVDADLCFLKLCKNLVIFVYFDVLCVSSPVKWV